jgi:hypothetical protein
MAVCLQVHLKLYGWTSEIQGMSEYTQYGGTMKRLVLAATTLSIVGMIMTDPTQAQTQTPSPTATKMPVVFACNMKAMSPAQRKRHSDVLSPALQSAKLNVNELPDGYAFQFPSDTKTYQTVAEWVANERLCCPFFNFDISVGDDSAPMTLRITGPDGVKQFIKAELSGMVR